MLRLLLRSGRHTRHRGVYRRVLAVGTATVVILALALTVSAVNVAGIATEIKIPITKIVRAPSGSETFLASAGVPDEFVGKVCNVITRSENQGSVHPDNDLVVSSGGSEVVLRDVEGVSDGIVLAQGSLQLGSDVVVTLIMGPDKVFSAGMTVVVDCASDTSETTSPGETTTTVEVLPTEVTATTTPVDATTIPDEVLPTEVTPSTVPVEVLPTEAVPAALPFTGLEADSLSLLALALGGAGILFLVATRSIVEGRHEKPRGQRRSGVRRRR